MSVPARASVLAKAFPFLKPNAGERAPVRGQGEVETPGGFAVLWGLQWVRTWAAVALRKRPRASGEQGLRTGVGWEGKGCGEEP